MSFNLGHTRTAIVTMRVNRWRSLLTVFGVVVGVASVIVVVGISQGVKNSITNQVNSYSKNVITITSNATTLSSLGVTSVPDVSTLTNQDVRAIAKDKGVVASVPLAVLSGITTGYRPYYQGIVIATTNQLPDVLNQSLAYGTFFGNQNGNNNNVVLGASAASGLFKQDIPLGYTLNWRNMQLNVDGVLNSFKSTPFSNNTIYNRAIFMLGSTAQQINQGSNSIFEILVKASSSKQLATVDSEVKNTLFNTHGGQKNYSVLLPSQVASSNTNILNLMTELIIGVAIISLFVGGVGIMNVMLVSVTERMHEIGIRKAIGATSRQIMSQFLVEAITVSLVGGLLGVIVSLIIDAAITLSTNLSPVISWQVIVLSVALSIVIGVVFGLIPAFRAARKQPIAALRND